MEDIMIVIPALNPPEEFVGYVKTLKAVYIV